MINNRDYYRPTEEEVLNFDRDKLWEKYRQYYEEKRKKFEEYLRQNGNMEQKNRKTPKDIEEKIENALSIQNYTIAKTMPKNPHQYCIRKKWIGYIKFIEVVELMREYGYVENFYDRLFLMFNVGNFKYWTMGYPIKVTTLINRTTIQRYSFDEFCNVVRSM